MKAIVHVIEPFVFYTSPDMEPAEHVEGNVVYSDGAGMRIRERGTGQLYWVPNSNVRAVKILEDD